MIKKMESDGIQRPLLENRASMLNSINEEVYRWKLLNKLVNWELQILFGKNWIQIKEIINHKLLLLLTLPKYKTWLKIASFTINHYDPHIISK